MTIKIWKWRYLLYVRAACRRQTLRIASLLPRRSTVGYTNASTLNLPFILYCQQLAIGVNSINVCFSPKVQLRESNKTTVCPLLQGYMTEQHE